MGSWTWMNNPTGLTGGRAIDQCRAHPEVVAVLGGSRVWLTTDGGTNWIDRTSGMISSATFSDIAVDPVDPNIMVVTNTTYSSSIPKVRKTTDQGLTWTAIDAGLPLEPANTIAIDPSYPSIYFLGTDLGVYVSLDAGASWTPFNTGLPHVVVSDLRVHDSARILRAGTHGRGLWEVDISDVPTAVAEGRPTVQPLTLRVFGNPAREEATLHFGIRSAGQVHLGLFDLQGREVRKLVDSFRYPIMDTVQLDVRDLPNGIYFARLESGGAQVTQKVVVEK
jgi:hypothetical protein